MNTPIVYTRGRVETETETESETKIFQVSYIYILFLCVCVLACLISCSHMLVDAFRVQKSISDPSEIVIDDCKLLYG